MSILLRLILLIGAALCGGFVLLLGSDFSQAVEPQSYSAGISAFWVLAGAVVAAPLWVTAIIPSHFPNALKNSRRVSAAMLLFPTFLFGSIVWHNISPSFSGLVAASSALFQGVLLTTVCLTGLIILLWPELSAYAKRILTHHSSGTG
ncbi:MAG: hypothetical protein V4732_18405 [Pseudomonadota bacterium]